MKSLSFQYPQFTQHITVDARFHSSKENFSDGNQLSCLNKNSNIYKNITLVTVYYSISLVFSCMRRSQPMTFFSQNNNMMISTSHEKHCYEMYAMLRLFSWSGHKGQEKWAFFISVFPDGVQQFSFNPNDVSLVVSKHPSTRKDVLMPFSKPKFFVYWTQLKSQWVFYN